MVVRVADGVVAGSEVGEEVEDAGREGELDEHVHAGCEEWEGKVEVVVREHPFVVD